MNKAKSVLSLIFASSFAVSLVFGLTACSDDSDKSESKSGDHIWKHQTDALQTSKDVANQLQDSLNQQQKNMDENN